MRGSLARRLLFVVFMVLTPLTVVMPAVAAPTKCADLEVSDFSITPTTPIAGQPANIHIQVTNIGTCDTNLGFVVQWKQTQTAKSGPSANFPNLAAGASSSVDLPYTFDKGGNFLSVVTVDTDRTIPETNEDNNVAIFAVSVDPAQVDLQITSFVIDPNPVGQGLDATAHIVVQNTGNTDSPAFQVAWTPAANTPPVTQNVPTLAAGGSTNIDLLFNYPSLGTFASWVIVDATHLVSETNEFNNFAFTAVTVIPALPDLQVTNVVFSPPNPIAGQNVHVTVTVFNGGNTDTGGNFTVSWKSGVRRAPTLSTQALALGVGASEDVAFDYTYPSDGTFNTVATVDSNNTIYELNEGNNSFTAPLVVGPANIDLTINSVVITPATPQQGVDAQIDISISNLGNSDAGPFTVSWNPDAYGLIIPSGATLTSEVSSLAIGATTTVTFHYIYPAFGNFHTVAQVDAFNEIKETNETNNSSILDISVDPGNVNLKVTGFTIVPGSGTLERFQKATASITVQNTGSLDIGSFKIEWFLIDTNLKGPSKTVPGLHPGDSVTVQLTGTYFQPGTYTTKAVVDPDNKIVETDESTADNSITINNFVVKPKT